jgi:hypothetical protein
VLLGARSVTDMIVVCSDWFGSVLVYVALGFAGINNVTIRPSGPNIKQSKRAGKSRFFLVPIINPAINDTIHNNIDARYIILVGLGVS